MARLELGLLSAPRLHMFEGGDERAISLTFQCYSRLADVVDLQTEDDWHELEGSIRFERYENDRDVFEVVRDFGSKQEAELYGLLDFFEAYENLDGEKCNTGYHARVLCSPKSFDFLLKQVGKGNLPERIGLDIPDLQYGPAPDGRWVKWQNKDMPTLKIFKYDLSGFLESSSNKDST